MLQTVMRLPQPSRRTSYSISFQPAMHFSIRHWCTRERRSPLSQVVSSSSRFVQMPPPEPPSV